jgi:hypothetical protein
MKQINVSRLVRIVRRGQVVRRSIYQLYELSHPDEPWMSQGAVRYCEAHLTREHVGFEWGSGRSTPWFGSRLQSLLSIEHDCSWHATVTKKLQSKRLTNVRCRYLPLEHDPTEPTRPHYDPTPSYVQAVDEVGDETLDLVIVDGHYRQACILAALKKIKPGGLLLVDNTDRLPLQEWGVPCSWPIVHQSRNVMTQTTIWRKPQCTTGE